jgi:hypothetical protein
LTCLVFLGVTITVTRQLPGFNATSLPPDTLQIFIDALATLIETLDPGATDTPTFLAIAATGVLDFSDTRAVVLLAGSEEPDPLPDDAGWVTGDGPGIAAFIPEFEFGGLVGNGPSGSTFTGSRGWGISAGVNL